MIVQFFPMEGYKFGIMIDANNKHSKNQDCSRKVTELEIFMKCKNEQLKKYDCQIKVMNFNR
jgi:uncharacterized protein YecT (DUF1311 family)